MMSAHAGTEIFRFRGEKMVVHYHRPAGPKRRRFPTVLFLHGFPGSEKGVDIQRALMAKGVATVAPSFLGAWGSGGLYRFTTLPAQARAVLKAAGRLPFVDSRRLGVYGFSMGGWAALNMAAQEPRLKAVAVVAPVGGREMIGPGTLDFITRLSRPLNTLPPRALAADFAKAVGAGDPARAASRIKAPLLLVHGDADSTIPAAVSRRIAAHAAGPVRLSIERGAEHDFLDRRARLTRLCADFLARGVKG
ncbi:MAG: alpha/beta fold hydrolase [Elusimicrobia bacterium]|nr:alpha/beta fold hydrolase [Elusimicrobiota bacterium]